MRRARRVLGYVAASLVALVLLAYGVVYVVSEIKVRRTFAIVPHPIAVPSDSGSVAEGARLARLRGCVECHGIRAQGDTFVDQWMLARVISPDLTRSVRAYTNTQLEAIIRQGARPGGRSVVVMPSGMFAPLADRDLGAIIAFLRQLPEQNGPRPEVRLGPLARVAFTVGEFVPAAEEVRRAHRMASAYPAEGEPHHLGAYLARTVCTECHGFDLRGDGSGRRPDLRIAAAYSLGAFAHLMRTGKAPGERELDLMSRVARSRFTSFTDHEIAALHGYLVARAKH
jgi:cytochrome c553